LFYSNIQLNPQTVFWTNVGKIVLIYLKKKILPLIWMVQDLATFACWTHTHFLWLNSTMLRGWKKTT